MMHHCLRSLALAAMLPASPAVAGPAREHDFAALRPLDIARLPVREGDIGVSRVATVSLFTDAELIDEGRTAGMVGLLAHRRIRDRIGVGLLVPVSSIWYSDFERITELAVGSPRIAITGKLYARSGGGFRLGYYAAAAVNWQQSADVLGHDKKVTGSIDTGIAFTLDGETVALHVDAGGHVPFGAANARDTMMLGSELAMRATSRLTLHVGAQAAIDAGLRPYWTVAPAASLGSRVSVGRSTEVELGGRYAFNPEAELIYNSLGRWAMLVDVVHVLAR